MAELITPAFLENHSVYDVFAKQKSVMPKDIDLSEGGHSFNFLMAAALIVAEAYEFTLPEVIKLIFPEYSYGEFLDEHAKSRKLFRKSATAASGKLTLTVVPGSVIPAGTIFSTAAVNGRPSVDYVLLETLDFPRTSEEENLVSTVEVDIRCTQTGTIGNADANTIILVNGRFTGIVDITNVEPMTGGTDEEDDEALIERIMAYDQNLGNNFVGSLADYKYWATEVDGVGNATIIPSEDTTGLITIIITDANGDPATEELCTSVYNHIMRPDSPFERLAPINAYIKVVPPQTIEISISATVELTEDATLESVKAAFMTRLAAYLPVAMDEREIKYTRVAAALASTDGANDFSGLQIGLKIGNTISYGTANIPVTTAQLPTIDLNDLILTSGTV